MTIEKIDNVISPIELTIKVNELIEKINNSNRNIGEIVVSSLPLTDSNLHLLDGSVIQKEGIYENFVNYVANLYEENSNANYFTNEAAWQNTVTQKGVCGKFVYNATNNTVRLPKITGIIEGTNGVNNLGNIVDAGLPNITGSFGVENWGNNSGSGAISGVTTGTSYHQGGDAARQSITYTLNAANSSGIYGNSNTVQPQTIKVLYYIVIKNKE